jgi:hypothetical protein
MYGRNGSICVLQRAGIRCFDTMRRRSRYGQYLHGKKRGLQWTTWRVSFVHRCGTNGTFCCARTGCNTVAKVVELGPSLPLSFNCNCRRFHGWRFTSGQFLPPTLIFVHFALPSGEGVGSRVIHAFAWGGPTVGPSTRRKISNLSKARPMGGHHENLNPPQSRKFRSRFHPGR